MSLQRSPFFCRGKNLLKEGDVTPPTLVIRAVRQKARVIITKGDRYGSRSPHIALYGFDVGLGSMLEASSFSYLLRVRRDDFPCFRGCCVLKSDVAESL